MYRSIPDWYRFEGMIAALHIRIGEHGHLQEALMNRGYLQEESAVGLGRMKAPL